MLAGRGRAQLDDTRRRHRAHAGDLALLPREHPGRTAGCERLPRPLLPFPRHGERTACLAVRGVHRRQRVPAGRDARGGGVLRGRRRRGARDPRNGAVPVRACRLDVGLHPERHARTRLAPGNRLHPVPLGRIRRGAAAVCAGTRLACTCAVARFVCGVVLHLRMEALLRRRLPLLRTPVHPPAVARVDRFPRHPGCVPAGQGHRLFRE